MSSKRGRKRNDNLPPNRARDVQRAFRARRAAHLQALEERMSELEAENDCLRQALSLPPSNRPPLGRGPTGKDRPRPFDTSSLQSLSPSRESSADLSPISRPTSQSPPSITASMSSCAGVMEPSAWNESMLLNDQSLQTQQSHQHHSDLAESSNSSYHLSPMPAPVPKYFPYVNSIASSSRQSASDIYLDSSSTYAESSDRPTGGNYGGHNFPPRDEIRNEIRDEIRQQYVYTHPYQHDPNVRSQSPSQITQSHPHVNSPQRDVTIPFPHRRPSFDPQGYSIGQGFPHLPNPRPDHPRQPDHLHVLTVSRPTHYGEDGPPNPVL